MANLKWKRLNYLAHRWTSIVLGVILVVWFGSGFVMMYYPYPILTGEERLDIQPAFEPAADLVGFPAAYQAALADFEERGHPLLENPQENIIGGRLMLWNGRPVYQMWHQRGYRIKPYSIVDARTGDVLAPISEEQAAGVARAALGPNAPAVTSVETLPIGDHYVYHVGYDLEEFPIYRVNFADHEGTSFYVGQETGNVHAVVDRYTRITSWLGPVPHWLYFQPLLQRRELWTWINLVLPGIVLAISLTGIVLGLTQLFPRRKRGDLSVSPYRGVSKWHHITGVVFGVLVFTWTLSAIFELLGPGSTPRAGQAAEVREGAVQWSDIRITEREALESARMAHAAPVLPVAIDLVQLDGRPGYNLHLDDGRSVWVDAVDGSSRGRLTEAAAARAAQRVMGDTVQLAGMELLTEYDTYYYARHGRAIPLPVWRASFNDEARSMLYLDAVTGVPHGYVDNDFRTWRWLRDFMHTLDFPAIVHKRPIWDLVILPLVIGGLVSSVTGVWLAIRRLRRLSGSPQRAPARDKPARGRTPRRAAAPAPAGAALRSIEGADA